MGRLKKGGTGPPGNIIERGQPAIQLNAGNTAYFMIECETFNTYLGIGYGPGIRTS